MKTVAELLKTKPARNIVKVRPDQSVLEAIKVLAAEDIGAAVVMSGDRMVGIFSERDYTRKIVLKGRASETTRVEEVMTPKVITVTHRTNLRECMSIMTERTIRHLPVVDGEKVVGMVSIRDIVGDIIADQDFTIEQLEHYISGN